MAAIDLSLKGKYMHSCNATLTAPATSAFAVSQVPSVPLKHPAKLLHTRITRPTKKLLLLALVLKRNLLHFCGQYPLLTKHLIMTFFCPDAHARRPTLEALALEIHEFCWFG
jgi:hypothetical protein